MEDCTEWRWASRLMESGPFLWTDEIVNESSPECQLHESVFFYPPRKKGRPLWNSRHRTKPTATHLGRATAPIGKAGLKKPGFTDGVLGESLPISTTNRPLPEPETPVRPVKSPILLCGKLNPPVFCETFFSLFETYGPLLAITDNRQPTFGNSQRNEDSFDRLRPPLTQG